MIVRMAVLADAANVSQEGKLNILGIFDLVSLPEFPGIVAGACLVLVIEAHPTEAGDHEVQIVLVDEDGKQVFSITGALPVQEPAERAKPVKTNIVLGLPPVRLPHAGAHSFDVLIDGRYETSIPLTAQLGPKLPGAGGGQSQAP